jgi:hypothetical protein
VTGVHPTVTVVIRVVTVFVVTCVLAVFCSVV